ncbi:MAG: hypothetical protein RIF41_27835 [Polyangiaceae bacterium]
MVLCAAVTAVALGGHALHMTLVAHAVCPSHGGMVHGDHHDDHGAEATCATPVATGDGDEGDHGHCDLPGVMATLVAVAAPAPPIQHLTWAEAHASRGVDVVPSRRRRLLLAPKMPPPA